MVKVKRLFKVAKELNVATAVLVEHLKEKGHSIENSPNAKIPAEMYELLLKNFASDKLMKEKAEQIVERRNEERITSATLKKEPTPQKTTEEELDGDIVSAAQLRKSASLQDQISAKETTVVEETVVKEPVSEPVVTETTAEPPVEEKKEEEVVTAAEPTPLKVIGKIDLDQFKTTSKKSRSKSKDESTTEKPKTEEVKVEETPVVEEPVAKKEAPKKEEKPVVEEKVAEVVEQKVEKVIEEKAPPVEETPVVKPVITADKNAPQLSGLKVLGKIDLKKDEKKKSKDTEKAKSQQSTKQEDGDGDANKRKRKRKRKRKKAVRTDVQSAGKQDGNRRGKSGKEKPTQKEIDASIRNTMAQMNKGASRNRQRLRRSKRDADAERRRQQELLQEEESRVLEVTEFITANEFANLISVPVNDIIKSSFELGQMITINQRLSAELLDLIASEYNYEVKFVDAKEQEFIEIEEEDNEEDLKERNAIITVMGHVDHGKTTLLDHLRKANVAEGEAGGITQHIGAYEVNLKSGKKVTFLDTPGHEAFTAMRARGAQVTDIVIVVIAADDAVMPQTREAINHAQAAGVPMVFAFNKMDKPGADAEKIKGQLAEMNILVEDWGGDFQSQEISAKMGTNVDELLEKVTIQADLLELKANPDRVANGTVIESRLDKGRGNVATILIQNGTLSVGDAMVAGIHFGKVRALISQNGDRIKKAGPSVPVQVLGLGGQPTAGDKFQVFNEEGTAKSISQKRQELVREQQFRQNTRITLEEIARRRAIGTFNKLNIIVKGDVDGSVEALSGSLLKLSTEEVQVDIILKAVGGITETDVNLASASDAVIIAFNTRPTAQARTLAEREEIDIRTYSVIYDAINDVKDALEGLLSPEIKEEVLGTAEVREVFKVTRVGNVGGCMVTSGKIVRNEPVRIIRDGVVIYTSKLSSLKRFKDDAKEVASGFECGIMVENYNDIKVGDVIENYREIEVKRRLK